jgi:SAM-dependent methyltransferase
MNDFWRSYWASYGPDKPNGEADLFRQVGHTVGKQPIPYNVFEQIFLRISTLLGVSQDDHVLDLCCGNGLISYELAKHAGHVTGIDFVERNIAAAKEYKSSSNITYLTEDVTQSLVSMFESTTLASRPNKILMYFSLGYFIPSQLSMILQSVTELSDGRNFRILLGGVPNSALKNNFYNTEARRERHEANEIVAPNTNDGMGRWWSSEEIEDCCQQRGLVAEIINQPSTISNFRMDAVITPASYSNE